MLADNNIILDKNDNITGIIIGWYGISNRCVEIATCMAYIAILVAHMNH